MVRSNLLASGSVSGFIEEKHFNRCKRLHPLMAVGLETLHLESFLKFQTVFFSIKKTNKPFSKQPIDLVLEQTINADAARRLTGIIQFTNFISARQRWALYSSRLFYF